MDNQLENKISLSKTLRFFYLVMNLLFLVTFIYLLSKLKGEFFSSWTELFLESIIPILLFFFFIWCVFFIFDIKPVPKKNIFSANNIEKTAQKTGSRLFALLCVAAIYGAPLFLISISRIYSFLPPSFSDTFNRYFLYFVFFVFLPPMVLTFIDNRKKKINKPINDSLANRKFKMTKAGVLFTILLSGFLFSLRLHDVIDSFHNLVR